MLSIIDESSRMTEIENEYHQCRRHIWGKIGSGVEELNDGTLQFYEIKTTEILTELIVMVVLNIILSPLGRRRSGRPYNVQYIGIGDRI